MQTIPPRGIVYGVLLNDRGALAALGEGVREAPYKAPPRAPVMFIKPANTHSVTGAPIVVPPEHDALRINAALGVVIGAPARRVREADALEVVAGYVVVCDVTVPHDSYYRPPVRFNCRDGFCPISTPVARAQVADPDRLRLTVHVDDVLVQEGDTANLIRPVRRLIADVTEFVTLMPGDILLTGSPAAPPLARPGQRVRVTIAGVGEISNPVVREEERS